MKNTIKKTLLILTPLAALYACSYSDNKKTQAPKREAHDTISKRVEVASNSASTNKEASSRLASSATEESSTLDYRSDSLDVFFKKQYEIEYYKIGKDTLEIVSGSDFLYYPLGSCQGAACLKSKLPKFAFQTEIDATDEPVNLEWGTFNNSFIKMIYDPEKKRMQIVSGKIVDPEVVFTNGIRPGISKERFMSLFIKDHSFTKGSRPKIVQLTSVVNGISHIYSFEDNALKSIEFNTDYVLNKK